MSREFLLMASQEGAEKLSGVFGNTISFVEVQGLDVAGSNGAYKVLITPLQPKKIPLEHPSEEINNNNQVA